MFSNFDKLRAAQPQPAKKRKEPSSETTKTTQQQPTTGQLTSISSNYNHDKLSQLQELNKLTALTAKGEKKIFKPTKKIDLAPPPKVGVQTINHYKNNAKPDHHKDGRGYLSNEEFALLRQQKERIELYKKDWFLTRKNKINVPPLHDPVVVTYHYGLGKREMSIFEEADRIRWKRDHPNRPYEEKEDDSMYEHVLLRLVVATKYGEIVYDKLVQPKTKVTNYRTDITRISKQTYQYDITSKQSEAAYHARVVSLERAIADMSEIIDNRVVIGYDLCAQNIHKTPVKLLLQQYQVNHALTKQEIDELLEDKRLEQKTRSKNHLFDLLLISHPPHLVRDLLSGLPFPVKHNESTDTFGHANIPTAQQLIQKYLKTVRIDLKATNGNGLNKDKQKMDKSAPLMNYDNMVIDKFTYMNSKPLDVVSLDGLYNTAFDMLQMYYLYKFKWEKLITKAAPTQMKQYKTKVLKLMKEIELNKEKSVLIQQNRREKVLRQRERRKQRENGLGSDDDDDRWGGSGSDDDSDLSDLSDSGSDGDASSDYSDSE